MVERDAIIDILIANAKTVFNAAMTFHRAPTNEALYQLLKHPQPGDMVLVLYTRYPTDATCIGTLLKVVEEVVVDSTDWDEQEYGPIPRETCWYIRDLNGNEQRWYSVQLIRVLEQKIDTIKEARERGLYDWQPES